MMRRMSALWACAFGVVLALAVAPGVAQGAGVMPAAPWTAAAPPPAGGARERPAPRADPATLLVRFTRGADAGARGAALRDAGAAGHRRLRGSRFELVSVARAERRSALQELRRDPAVAEAQPNFWQRRRDPRRRARVEGPPGLACHDAHPGCLGSRQGDAQPR